MPDGTNRRRAPRLPDAPPPGGPGLPRLEEPVRPRPGGAVRPRPGAGARRIDLGDILVGSGPTVIERPSPAELPDVLRDRVGRLKLPPPVSGTKPGTLAETVAVGDKDLAGLLRGATQGGKVVWSVGGSEVLVHLDGITATVVTGAVAVLVPVESDQTGRVELPVVFAVGTEDREAGLMSATPARPPGPAALVDRWGEAVQALAWDALLQVAVALAAQAGTDARGDPLVPIALRATPDRFVVIPQARHRKLR